MLAAFSFTAEVALAQEPQGTASSSVSTSEQSTTSSVLEFLGGGALALGAHESGHLLFDAIFDANAGLKNRRVLRKTRSSPAHASQLVDAIQALIIEAEAV